jgi:hypothetical protein
MKLTTLLSFVTLALPALSAPVEVERGIEEITSTAEISTINKLVVPIQYTAAAITMQNFIELPRKRELAALPRTNPSPNATPDAATITQLAPPLGFQSGVNPTGTGDCDGAIDGADGKPIKIPCSCPPPQDEYISVGFDSESLRIFHRADMNFF